MRCMYCDYCPTAPSLSSNHEKPVKLFWDEHQKGWHCRDQCLGDASVTDNPYLEDELVEVVEVPPTLPEG